MHCRRSDNFSALDSQRGAALIVAMLIFALAASLVVALQSEFNRYFQRSANLLSDEQAQAYLRGGEALAAMVLIDDYDNDKREGLPKDDLDENWAKVHEQPPYPLDGVGWMAGKLEDLQGRFNLNLLAEKVPEDSPPDQRFTAAQAMFIRLLQALGDPPGDSEQEPVAISEQEAIAITESISDWLDADDAPLRDGAEDTFYYGRTPAHRAGNRLFASVSELRAVANMTPEIYGALRDLELVTVLPDSNTLLNMHTMQPMLWRGINEDKELSPLSMDEGQSLFDAQYEDKNALKESAAFKGKTEAMTGTLALLDRNSSYFLLTVTGELAGREMRLYSVLKRQNRAVGAVARANSPL